jgi:hypothetical protein
MKPIYSDRGTVDVLSSSIAKQQLVHKALLRVAPAHSMWSRMVRAIGLGTMLWVVPWTVPGIESFGVSNFVHS